MKRTLYIPALSLMLAGLFLSACDASTKFPGISNAEIDSSNAMEFTGAVDSIGSEAWSVGGLTVGISAATEITGDPQVGDLVKVHARLVGPDSLIATEIGRMDSSASPEASASPESEDLASKTPPAPGQEMEFVGAVLAINPNVWIVGDKSLAVTTETEIKGTIGVGDLVKVHALIQPDLSLTAREIEPAGESDALDTEDSSSEHPEDLEFKGVVQAMEGENWTVAGVTFVVPATATIEGAIRTGDFVEISAFWSTDGLLTATRVKLEDQESSGKSDGDSSGDHNDGGSDDQSGDQPDDSSSGGHGGDGGGSGSGSR